MTIDGWCNHRCVYLCVCVCVCVWARNRQRMHSPLRACVRAHVCCSMFFPRESTWFPIGPWEPLGLLMPVPISLRDLRTFPCIPPARSAAGPQLEGRNKITERVAASQFIWREKRWLVGGVEGGGGGDYRLLSNALLRGQNQRRYLREPQEVEEKKRELATEKKDLCQGLWPPTEYDVRV